MGGCAGYGPRDPPGGGTSENPGCQPGGGGGPLGGGGGMLMRRQGNRLCHSNRGSAHVPPVTVSVAVVVGPSLATKPWINCTICVGGLLSRQAFASVRAVSRSGGCR